MASLEPMGDKLLRSQVSCWNRRSMTLLFFLILLLYYFFEINVINCPLISRHLCYCWICTIYKYVTKEDYIDIIYKYNIFKKQILGLKQPINGKTWYFQQKKKNDEKKKEETKRRKSCAVPCFLLMLFSEKTFYYMECVWFKYEHA